VANRDHSWYCCRALWVRSCFTEERVGPSPVAPRPREKKGEREEEERTKRGRGKEKEKNWVVATLLSGTHRSRTRLCADLKRPEKEREKRVVFVSVRLDCRTLSVCDEPERN
jgi:hypothetical protein